MDEWWQKVAESSRKQQKVTESNKRKQKVAERYVSGVFEKLGMTKQGWIASFVAMTIERFFALLRMTRNYSMKNYIMPTLGAMVGVTPLLLWSMEQTNIASPFFNFLVVPLVPIVTIGGFIVPFLPDWMSRCVVYFVHLVEWIVQVSASG